MSDVIVVGGGVIGLSVAWELAGQGARVTLLEQGGLGSEASWAGAGILPPGNLEQASTPQGRLRALSHRLWPQWSAELQALTGIDNGYRNCGGIEVSFASTHVCERGSGREGEGERAASPTLLVSPSPRLVSHRTATEQVDAETAAWRADGVSVERLSAAELREREPAIADDAVAGYRLPELSQVRNPRHLKALIAGCAAQGVRFVCGCPVVGFERAGERITAVRMAGETFAADRFCVAAGAWSRSLLGAAGCAIAVKPVRGQIVLLNAQPVPFRHVLQVGSRYLVPRPDGRVLIGSTEEDAGFEKRNTAGAVRELIEFGTGVVPCLAKASFERAWCGLRPGTADGLPFLGRVPSAENLFVAAGHFRAGLQLSPATGVVMRQVILGQGTAIPLEGFEVERG